MKILIIAPHPDDEVLGCGGSIVNHTKKGDEVHICYITVAYYPDWSEEFIKNRPKEIKKVLKVLGVKKSYNLDFPTVKLDTIPRKDLNDSLYKIVKKIKPDIAYIPHIGDLNHDHQLIHKSALVALRPSNCKVKKILSYEVLSETEWGPQNNSFNPNYYVNISKTFKDKIRAMKVYNSELKEKPHPRSTDVIEALAIKRGSEIGVNYAEAFMVIREIVS